MRDSIGGTMSENECLSPLIRRGLILLNPSDNCYVITRDFSPGEVVDVEGGFWNVTVALSLGHKIARCPIKEGDTVMKLGVPIGEASTDIGMFEHIHLHNLRSQYIPTYERGDSSEARSVR